MRRLLAAALAALFLAAGLVEAAVTATPVFLQKIGTTHLAQIINSTGFAVIATDAASVTNTVAAYTCGADGSKITGMVAGSTDTATALLEVFIVNTSKVYLLGTFTVPINAGNVSSTPVLNLMSSANMPGLPADSDGNPYFTCVTGDVIRVGVQTAAVTANKAVTVTVVGADF